MAGASEAGEPQRLARVLVGHWKRHLSWWNEQLRGVQGGHRADAWLYQWAARTRFATADRAVPPRNFGNIESMHD